MLKCRFQTSLKRRVYNQNWTNRSENMVARHKSFSDQLTAFASYLRSRSYVVGVEEVQISLHALTHIDIGQPSQFLSILKIVFSCTPMQWRDLEDHYRTFLKEYKRAVNSKIKQLPEEKSRNSTTSKQPRKYQLENVKSWLFKNSPELLATPFYSNQAASEYSDLSDLAFEENGLLKELIQKLVKCLAQQKRRRKKNHLSRGEINLSELLRTKFLYGDELLRLVFRYRPKRKTKLILLCDVSRSMDLFSHFLSHFIFHLQNTFQFQTSYVFNTQLHRLGKQGRSSWKEMLGDFAEIPGLWGEGTKIGACLQSFIMDRPGWFDRYTKVVVFSDGWDMGELGLLEDCMLQLQRMSGQLIWLNPVLKNPEAERVSGMQVIKAHVDLLAPLYDIKTLQDLIVTLSK